MSETQTEITATLGGYNDTVIDSNYRGEFFTFRIDNPSAENCGYWCAIGGKAFGIVVEVGRDRCCIAVVDKIIRCVFPYNQSWEPTYVIWAPKNRTDGNWKRWQTKWSKRTAL